MIQNSNPANNQGAPNPMLRRNQGMISSACKTSLSLFSQMEMVRALPVRYDGSSRLLSALYTECIPAHGFPAYQG